MREHTMQEKLMPFELTMRIIQLGCSHVSPTELEADIEEIFFDYIEDEHNPVVSVDLSSLPQEHAESMFHGMMRAAELNGMTVGMPFLDRLSDYEGQVVPMEQCAIKLISKHLLTKVTADELPRTLWDKKIASDLGL